VDRYITFQVFEREFNKYSPNGSIVIDPSIDKIYKKKIDGVKHLFIPANVRNMFELITDHYAQTVSRYSREIIQFMNQVDPKKGCRLVSQYPILEDHRFGRKFIVYQSAELSRYLEKKSNLSTISENLKVKNLPSKIIFWCLEEWLEYVQENPADQYVIQGLGNSAAGTKTFLINKFGNYLSGEVKISPYIADPVYVAGFNIFNDGEIYIYPIFQQNSLIRDNRIQYIGGNIKVELPNQIYEDVMDLAELMRDGYKYVGPMGIDFMYKDGIILLDINPRLTGSFANFIDFEQIFFDQKHEVRESQYIRYIPSLTAPKDLIVESKLKRGVYSSETYEFLREDDTIEDKEFFCTSFLKKNYKKGETVFIAQIMTKTVFPDNNELLDRLIEKSGLSTAL